MKSLLAEARATWDAFWEKSPPPIKVGIIRIKRLSDDQIVIEMHSQDQRLIRLLGPIRMAEGSSLSIHLGTL